MNTEVKLNNYKKIKEACPFDDVQMGELGIYVNGELVLSYSGDILLGNELEANMPAYNVIKGGLLDDLVGDSGYQTGRTYIIAGPAKAGKSLVLLNEAYSLSKNNDVLYISLENSLADTAKRVEGWTLTDLNYVHPLSCTIKDVERYAQMGYQVLVIDPFYYIEPINSELDLRLQYKDLIIALRNIAIKYNIVIITSAQLNRGALGKFTGEDFYEDFKKIDQTTIAESSDICRYADSVVITMRHKNEETGSPIQVFGNIASRINNVYDYCYIPYYPAVNTKLNDKYLGKGYGRF